MRSKDLKQALAQLTAVDTSDSAFLSCYLDAGRGKSACERFLTQKAAVIRQTLSGHARFDFDNALAALHRQLYAQWDDKAKGLAIFARGVAGGRHQSLMRFAAPFHNSLVLYRVPEILPLIELLQREPEFTLVLSQSGQVQVLDVDLGATKPRAFLNMSAMSKGPSLRLFQRTTAAAASPLLLAGDEATLAKIVDWLPQRAISRLQGTFAVPRGSRQHEAVASVARRFADIHAEESTQFAARLVSTLHRSGSVVFGHLATLEALRRGSVETLVIADRGRLDIGANWDPKIELSRQALRQGAQVLLADAAGLRRLGGVACLLRHRAAAPAATSDTGIGQLELVA